jgi:hypothetical protein
MQTPMMGEAAHHNSVRPWALKKEEDGLVIVRNVSAVRFVRLTRDEN